MRPLAAPPAMKTETESSSSGFRDGQAGTPALHRRGRLPTHAAPLAGLQLQPKA